MAELTNIERETVILYNQAEKTARISTEDPALIRRLTSILSQNSLSAQRVEERPGYMEVLVPKKWVKVVPPRVLSEEKKSEAAARLKAAREAKKNAESRDT